MDLEAAVAELQRDRDRQRQDFERWRQEYATLAGKLRFPGTDFLVKLSWQVVYEGTLTAEAGTLVASEIFDTTPGALHVPYVLSAYATVSSVPIVVSQGAITVAPADAVTVAIQRQLQTGPTRIEARVIAYASTATEHTIAVKVWKRLGMA